MSGATTGSFSRRMRTWVFSEGQAEQWFVGQKVACIRWDWEGGPFGEPVTMPIVGEVYTIRDISFDPALGGDCSLRFEEIINKPISFGTFEEPDFHCIFFRPVVESKTDIGELTRVNAGQPSEVDA